MSPTGAGRWAAHSNCACCAVRPTSRLTCVPAGAKRRLVDAFGLTRAAGLYLVAVAAFSVAAIVLLCLSTRRRPRRSAPQALVEPTGDGLRRLRRARRGLRAAPARGALAVLGAGNLVMVAVMAVAPVHLHAHGITLETIGIVISLHVAAMFAPAPISDWLADRVGAAKIAAAGTVLLAVAGVAGTLVADERVASIAGILVVLGVGWNCGVVGASALLAASTPTAVRADAEGIGEATRGLAAAIGAPLAGLVAAGANFGAVWLAAVGVAVCALAWRARCLDDERRAVVVSENGG